MDSFSLCLVILNKLRPTEDVFLALIYSVYFYLAVMDAVSDVQ